MQHSSTEDAQVIFRDAAYLNMTEAGHVWIVTEQALHANNIPEGVLGLQLEHSNDELKHIRVSSMFLENFLASTIIFASLMMMTVMNDDEMLCS